jgi:hypothetical protein
MLGTVLPCIASHAVRPTLRRQRGSGSACAYLQLGWSDGEVGPHHAGGVSAKE